jgi:hypothetical protein
MIDYEIQPEFPIEDYFETKTMKDVMKIELLVHASKFTLEELEERLGTKNELMFGKIKQLQPN